MANFGKIAKWGLVGFNVFFLLAGLAILAASIYYYITQPLIQDFSIGVMIISIFVIIFSIIGIIAATVQANQKVFLIIYLVLIILILGAEIGIAVASQVYTSDLENYLYTEWINNPNGAQSIENSFSCCGFGNATDHPMNGTCCFVAANDTANPNYAMCVTDHWTSNANTVQVPGCFVLYHESFLNYIIYVEAAGGLLAALEIFGLIFTIILLIKESDTQKDMQMNDYS